jgi:hypothetical protein
VIKRGGDWGGSFAEPSDGLVRIIGSVERQ